ncbi:MAG: Trm112 family protein [Ilumatobacteraceae bacterium]
MALDQRLLDILACPKDKGPLHYLADEGVLYNTRLHLAYAVRDDIPVMLIDEATTVSDSEHERLSALITEQSIPSTF